MSDTSSSVCQYSVSNTLLNQYMCITHIILIPDPSGEDSIAKMAAALGYK